MTETQSSPRKGALAKCHKALGATFDPWNGMDVALEYNQDLNTEYEAVRTKAGLFDVSGLKKVWVTGPDAFEVCNYTCSRDLSLIYPGKSVYTVILNNDGLIQDDCIIFHMAPDCWLVVHSSGATMELLQESAQGKDVDIKFDDHLNNIALQGPDSVDFLNQHTPVDLPELRYFHHLSTTLFGHDCMISRTGYSGERGYEIFATPEHIVPIWEMILEAGKGQGIVPCSFTCLDMVRVEANLLFYEFDMTENDTPWDVGLGFAVSKKKAADFRGKEAVMASMANQKTTTLGLISDAEQIMDIDAKVFCDGKEIGFVTAPLLSTIMKKSVAMFRVDLEFAKPGLEVEVRGENLTCKAVTSDVPLLDPKKQKRVSNGF